jgi:hypothetical protein
LAEKGRRIRSIWIADTASQGASGLLNEDTKFDDGNFIACQPISDFADIPSVMV